MEAPLLWRGNRRAQRRRVQPCRYWSTRKFALDVCPTAATIDALCHWLTQSADTHPVNSHKGFCDGSDVRKGESDVTGAATIPWVNRVTRWQRNNRGISTASRRRLIQFKAHVSRRLFSVWHNLLPTQAVCPKVIVRRRKRSFGNGTMALMSAVLLRSGL